jgi:hypothetical protein
MKYLFKVLITSKIKIWFQLVYTKVQIFNTILDFTD